jgi:hypothetical protein
MTNKLESRFKGHSLWELVLAINDQGQVGSQVHSEVQAALQAAVTEHLAASIDRHEKAASRLTVQVLGLNIILGVFTVVGTILAIIAFIQE